MATQTSTSTSKRQSPGKYMKSVRMELKKVNWPNRAELKNYTGVVLVSCALVSFGIWILDSVFAQFIKMLIN